MSRKSLLGIFLVFGILWLLSFHNRFIEADECILGEYSYSFLNEGIVRVKSIPAIQDWDVRLFPHHRFFTWYGAAVIGIFGWSIVWLKTSMLPWYGLFFLFLYRFFKLKESPNNQFILASLLIFTTPIILLKSFSFRPDILLMTEGMALLYFLSRYRLDNKPSHLIFAGIAAGLGFLTHLNGLAFCIAGFFFLIFRKEYKGLIPFTLAGAVVGAVYFIELLPGNNFERFIYQLTHWPTVNHGENYLGTDIGSLIWKRVVKLLSEHKRFFWGDRVMGFSALFFLTVLLTFRKIKEKYADVLLFFVLLVLSLNIFGSHVAERYILFYYGPMVIILSYGLLSVSSSSWKKLVLLIGLFFHFALGINMMVKIFTINYDVPGVNAQILSRIEKSDAKTLVPYEMIYNEFPQRNLYVYKTYEYLGEELPGGEMSQEQLFKKAHELGMEYIVINKQLANDKGRWFYNWEVADNEYFAKYHKDSNSLILKRISTSP